MTPQQYRPADHLHSYLWPHEHVRGLACNLSRNAHRLPQLLALLWRPCSRLDLPTLWCVWQKASHRLAGRWNGCLHYCTRHLAARGVRQRWRASSQHPAWVSPYVLFAPHAKLILAKSHHRQRHFWLHELWSVLCARPSLQPIAPRCHERHHWRLWQHRRHLRSPGLPLRDWRIVRERVHCCRRHVPRRLDRHFAHPDQEPEVEP